MATENNPSPAINGPICIPNISKITAKPIIQIRTLKDFSNHEDIAEVSHEFPARNLNKGSTAFTKTLKIVKTTKALTIFVAITSIRPAKGK